MHCLPPQPNSVMYGKAYSRGMSFSGRQRRQRRSWSAEAPPLSALSPADRKPRYTPHTPCYVKTGRHPQNREVHDITYALYSQTRTEPCTATGNVADRKVPIGADRQTDTLIAILGSNEPSLGWSTCNYTVSQKNVPPLTCYLYIHGSITTVFGTNVAEKVCNQKVLYFPT